MKQALIFHGTCDKGEYCSQDYPSLSNSHWFPWLQKQLLINGYAAHTPEVTNAYMPTYDKWLTEIQRYKIDENTLLVGHSCGAGFLVRWLSENNFKVGKVILVAPWLNPDKMLDIDMFEFQIDPKLTSKSKGITIFSSKNDMHTIQLSVKNIIDNVVDVKLVEFEKHGHFTFDDMKTSEFPELLNEVLL